MKAICWCLLLLPALCLAQPRTDSLRALVQIVETKASERSDSLEYYALKALALARAKNDIVAETKIQRLRAVSIFLDGQFDKAVALYLEAARKAEKYPPSSELALLYYDLSGSYSKNKYDDIAAGYIRKGLAIAQLLGNDTMYADGTNRMGIYHERKGRLDSALHHYNIALAYNQKMGTTLGTAYTLENIAGIYGQRNDHRTALRYLKQSLLYKEQTKDKTAIAIALINVGEAYAGLKQYDSAIHYAKRTINIASEIGYTDLLQYSYQFLSGLYEQTGNLPAALEYYKKFTQLNDSLFTETKTKQLAEFNTKYETEKKEQRIKNLNQENLISKLQIKQRNTWLMVAIGLLVAGGAISYLVYNRRKLKQEAALQAEINKQQEITTREVMHAEERERRRIAADLHDGVGQLLSAALMNLNGFFERVNISPKADPQAERTLALVTESYDELRTISHQMMPNALIKAGLSSAVKELIMGIDQSKISVSLDLVGIDQGLNEEVETVLYRVVQESVNNVIKHAQATRLNIQLMKDEEGVSLTIEDNGKGFNYRNGAGNGIGLKNMMSRIQFLKGTMDIDSAPGRGTLLAVHIPG